MKTMLASDKVALDKVGNYHPDFTRPGVPGADHFIPLGSYIASGMSCQAIAFTYDFAIHGGAISPDIVLGKLPAGAIVVHAWSDILSPVTIAVGSAWALKVGADSIFTIADPSTMAGIVAHTVTPVKAANTSAVALNIDVAATTAGKVRFIIQFLLA